MYSAYPSGYAPYTKRWQTLKNENTIQKKTSKVEFNYGNILAHIWNSTSCFQ